MRRSLSSPSVLTTLTTPVAKTATAMMRPRVNAPPPYISVMAAMQPAMKPAAMATKSGMIARSGIPQSSYPGKDAVERPGPRAVRHAPRARAAVRQARGAAGAPAPGEDLAPRPRAARQAVRARALPEGDQRGGRPARAPRRGLAQRQDLAQRGQGPPRARSPCMP